jgi:hypothetical protein
MPTFHSQERKSVRKGGGEVPVRSRELCHDLIRPLRCTALYTTFLKYKLWIKDKEFIANGT